MITVKGTARIFGRFASMASEARSALLFALLTQTKRAGDELAEVGPHLTRSYSERTVSSLTGESAQSFGVLALRNN
jgi:hypothetical protein